MKKSMYEVKQLLSLILAVVLLLNNAYPVSAMVIEGNVEDGVSVPGEPFAEEEPAAVVKEQEEDLSDETVAVDKEADIANYEEFENIDEEDAENGVQENIETPVEDSFANAPEAEVILDESEVPTTEETGIPEIEEETLQSEEQTVGYYTSDITYPVTYSGYKAYDEVDTVLSLLNETRAEAAKSNPDIKQLTINSELQKTAMERAKQMTITYDHTTPNPAQDSLYWGMERCIEIANIGNPVTSIETIYKNLIGEGTNVEYVYDGEEGAHYNIAVDDTKIAAGIGIYHGKYATTLVIHLASKLPTKTVTVEDVATENVSSSYFGILGYSSNDNRGNIFTVDTYPDTSSYTIYGRAWSSFDCPNEKYDLDGSLYTMEIESGEEYFSIRQSGKNCIITPKKAGTGYIVAKLKVNPDLVPMGDLNYRTQWNKIKVVIKERDLSDKFLNKPVTSITFDNTKDYEYTGKPVLPDDIVVTYCNNGSVETLKKDIDYTISTGETGPSDSATVTIKGTGIYSGSFTSGLTYNIVKPKIDLSAENAVKISGNTSTYTGKYFMPSLTVKYNSKTLTEGTDYYFMGKSTLKNAGTYTFKLKGDGDYTGSFTAAYTINPASLSGLAVSGKSVKYTGKDIPVTFDVIWNSQTLTQGTDYTLSKTTVKNAGSYKVSITGKGNFTGSTTATFIVKKNGVDPTPTPTPTSTPAANRKNISGCSVAGVSLSYGYSGNAYTPELTIKLNGVTLTKGKDYTVKYKNNKEPGTATITITGIGNYTGTKIRTFEIVDCISTLVSGKTYQLIPKNNSSTAVCSFAGRMLKNTKVYITNRSSSEAMRFKAIKNADGTWKFINAKCEMSLAVQQNSSEVGKGLVLYDQTTRNAQNWKLTKKFDNSFAIINAVSGLYVSMSDISAPKGTLLTMHENSGRGNQRFYIVETNAVDASFDGTYSVRASKNESYALNVSSSSTADGANVNLYKYNGTNAMKFKAIYSGAGYYRFVNMNSGLVLSVKGNTKKDGTNVIQSMWKAQSGQKWKITKNSNGTVTLSNALGTVLHLSSNKNANGANVVARNASTTGAQKWYLG